MRRNSRQGNRRMNAFTMVEVVAALAIAGGVIVGLLFARDRAVETCASARATAASARLCAALAARVRAGEIRESAGVAEEHGEFLWRVVTEGRPAAAPEAVRAYKVEVLPPNGDTLNGCIARVWRYEPGETEETAP